KQRFTLVARLQFKAEHMETGTVRKVSAKLGSYLFGFGIATDTGNKMGGCVNDRIVLLYRGSQGERAGGVGGCRPLYLGKYAIGSVFLFVELIITFLVRKHKDDQHAYGHGKGKSEHIDEGECFVFQDIPQSCFKIISEHWVAI